MALESRTLKNDVLAYLEKAVKFGNNRLKPFAVVCGDLRVCQDVLCQFSHAVEEGQNLLPLAFVAKARCVAEL